jgi:MSHA pilin protein MshD
MCSKSVRGFTLIEMVVVITIISVSIAGAMSVFSRASFSSADPIVRKQLLVVAEEIMEEVQLKPYTDPYGRTKSITGCERSGIYQVDQYDAYETVGYICDVDGVHTADLDTYGLKITVGSTTLKGVGTALKITVKVTKGSESLTLVGWRLNYA